ncbi:MAG: DUF2520 domain-containing protein [Candidatus Dormibacteraeota bacterium]|nr:DUF2520 domain-containing protein [Candidatus Dormibacteraeota bacterium]
MTETESGTAVVGAGRMGTALAIRLAQGGHRIGAVASRTPASAERLALATGAVRVTSPATAALSCRVTLITVPDSQIAGVAAAVAEAGAPDGLSGHVIAHCAGSLGMDPLRACALAGAAVAVLHPLAPVPDGDPVSLEGAFATLEADAEAAEPMSELCRWLGLGIIPWGGWDRGLYHAAAVLAGVLPAAIEGVAERAALANGMGEALQDGLRQLFYLAATNVRRLGPVAGLSGPTTRSDWQTTAAHRRALGTIDPRLAELLDLTLSLAPSASETRSTPGGGEDE